jgi:hypothetical protein
VLCGIQTDEMRPSMKLMLLEWATALDACWQKRGYLCLNSSGLIKLRLCYLAAGNLYDKNLIQDKEIEDFAVPRAW